MAEHTPGPWSVEVIRCSMGLEYTGYAHKVKIGIHDYVVAFTEHKNYEHIHTEDIGNGYVRQTGIGPREPDLTPHPDAILIAAAPEMLAALELLFADVQDYEAWQRPCHAVDVARAAIAKARGETS